MKIIIAVSVFLLLSVAVIIAMSSPGPDGYADADHDYHEHPDDHGEHDDDEGYDLASHLEPAEFDQAAIEGQKARIDWLIRANFEREGSKLQLDPVLMYHDVAIVGWVQGDSGGRALLEHDEHGLWRIAVSAGEGLKGSENMKALGLDAATADILAEAQAEAEAKLPAETIARFDAFGEAVNFD